jgi:Zn-finger nucleic acid-binding protein
MQAATLHCPDCGAPADPDARECPYCHARLATVACPHCFALVFVGMTHCPSCGAELDRHEEPDDGPALACPRCAGALRTVSLGATRVRECEGCGGLWVDNRTFLALCADRGTPPPLPPERGAPTVSRAAGGVDTRVKYLRCPVCRALLDRVNFARVSGVVVDVCAEHGTWFDRNELHRIIDFIAAGGLERSLAHVRDAAFQQHLQQVAGDVAAVRQAPVPDDRDAWAALFSHFTPHPR